MTNVLLRLQNATLRRSDSPVLSDVTWSVHAGEHWAILGENGSGKSSLLEALAGKLPVRGEYQHPVGPLAETVELLPKDFSFNRIVASAAQFYQQRFNSDAAAEAPTVRELLQNQMRPIGTVDDASVPLPPPQYPEPWLAEVADWVRIAHLLDRRLTSLSNGETRRTLLARSLLRRPRVLLLDNPFMGLDVASRQTLHVTLNRLASQVTLVLVTTPQEIPACVTDLLVLRDGTATVRRYEPGRVPAFTQKEKSTAQPVGPPVPEPEIRFAYAVRMRGVSVTYRDVRVLKDITWDVARGEKWAVLGPNGSGKSTLLSLITADNPQGYANDFDLFDRKRGSGESIWDIKSNIGFVSPELHLYFPRETLVWKVVASGLFDTAGLFRKLGTGQAEQVDEWMERLEPTPLREKRFSQLSTGQQRWTLLARALVKNPALLILDEPGQGLDPEHVTRFRDLIDRLCGHSERTLLYVSHYADEIPRCVTRVLRLEAGMGHVEVLNGKRD